MKVIGSCTQCGACCRFLSIEIHPDYHKVDDVRHWLNLHRITTHIKDGRAYADIPIPCTALKEDNRCSLHGTELKPRLCSEWPIQPSDLEDPRIKPFCTLTFQDSPRHEGVET